MITLIDNYDSFVFNLARYCEELGCQTEVLRSDEVSAEQLLEQKPCAVLISPGPCTPNEAGNSLEIVRKLSGHIPLLGVCLGHQIIAAAAGADIVRAPEPVHGRTSLISHLDSPLFKAIPKQVQVTRYHSLILDEQNLSDDFQITARTEDGIPMAIEHRRDLVMGVQFHPESILTDFGHRLISNFLTLANVPVRDLQSSELANSAEKYSTRPPAPVHTPGPNSLPQFLRK